MALNDLINNLRKGMLGLGLILAANCGGGAGDGTTSAAGCKHDSECKGNRICINGDCIEGSRNTPGKDTYSSLPDTYDNLDTSQNCTSHFKKVCSDGDLYWKDSCGNLENKLDNCSYGCSNGGCKEPGSDTGVLSHDTIVYDQGPSCNNECYDYEYGKTICVGNGWKKCGDYGGSCLEWGGVNNCGDNEVCQGGECISACVNECNSVGDTTCYNESMLSTCVVNNDCLKWAVGYCSGYTTCVGDECVCIDDGCNYAGEKICSNSISYQTCEDFDGCLIKSSFLDFCGGNKVCQDGECGCIDNGCNYDGEKICIDLAHYGICGNENGTCLEINQQSWCNEGYECKGSNGCVPK